MRQPGITRSVSPEVRTRDGTPNCSALRFRCGLGVRRAFLARPNRQNCGQVGAHLAEPREISAALVE